MRVLLIAAAAVTVTACTPRDNSGADRTLTQSPEAAVYGEPTVTGGAYDSIIYRVGRERGLPAPGAHGAAPADGAHGGMAGDSVALDSAAGRPSDDSAVGGAAMGDSASGDSAAQRTGGGPTH
jgi:hypothetical protein